MTLLDVINDLKTKAAECQAKVDANTVDAEGHSSKRWAFAVLALQDRIDAYTLILAAEEKGKQDQFEEMQRAIHREARENRGD